MLRFYSPLLLLQIFCFYHIYANSRDYKWYILVALLPLFGSIIYLYTQFVTNENVDKIQDGLTNIFVPDAEITKLEQTLEISDTVTNRLNLADAYLEKGETKKAISLYESSLEGAHQGDEGILLSLLEANFLDGDFEEVVEIGLELEDNPAFLKSQERVSYAMALKYTDQPELANKEFMAMDTKFSNYPQRIKYTRFLHSIGKKDEATQKLNELNHEISLMDRTEKRFKSEIIKEIQQINKHGFIE